MVFTRHILGYALYRKLSVYLDYRPTSSGGFTEVFSSFFKNLVVPEV
jgi:hypothetical protein